MRLSSTINIVKILKLTCHTRNFQRQSANARYVADPALSLTKPALEKISAKANMQSNNQGPWRQPTNEYILAAPSTAHASPHQQTTLKQPLPIQTSSNNTKSKRKATPDSLTISTQKKQKRVVKSHTSTENHPEPARYTHAVFVQPISNLILTNPLTNVERWRLRGWTWPEAVFRVGDRDDLVEVESPGGTRQK
jgi:hypothetical protein